MKTILTTVAVILLFPALASAQSNSVASVTTSAPATAHDVSGFTAKNYPGVSPEQANRAPNPNVVLKPKLGGVVTDGVKYGPEIISPGAPASWGNGEKYLSAPSSTTDLKHESGPAAHRDSGGLKLFTIEF
jgi:hypothetical protein